MPAPISLDRLIERIEFTPTCWNWKGAKTRAGYGVSRIGQKNWFMHRFAYYLSTLELPSELDHLCRNTVCMNPEHLEPVTHRENLLRGIGVAARNAKVTHCPRGHEYTPENTYRRPNRISRVCRECGKISSRLSGIRFREKE